MINIKQQKTGNRRMIKRFLWIPRKCKNIETKKFETRWLRFATIVQTYDGKWIDNYFLDTLK